MKFGKILTDEIKYPYICELIELGLTKNFDYENQTTKQIDEMIYNWSLEADLLSHQAYSLLGAIEELRRIKNDILRIN